ncbi:MAG: glycoside hydrolase family 99-like domain-containing protein [Thermoguttaceae bacterium]
MDKHADKAMPQRLLLIYAWNENGEGGYLTPTAKDGTEYLKAVQRAIRGDASTGVEPRALERAGEHK